MEEAPQVAIAEAGGGELAAGHGLQEREVGGVADAESADAPAVVSGRMRDVIEQVVEGGSVVDDGQGIEVALVGPLREFGATLKVGHPLAERAPRKRPQGIVLERAEDSEVSGFGDGRFDAQDPTGRVVHLDRVAVHPMLDANAFGPVCEAGREFADEVAVCLAAEEAHDVGTLEVQGGVADEGGVDGRQCLGGYVNRMSVAHSV